MTMMLVLWCIVFSSLFLTEGFNTNDQPSTQGFISIDCGIGTDTSYYDPNTGLLYVSDSQFTDAGTNVRISSNYINSTVPPQYQTVRSFPTGYRNCYTLPNATRGQKYYIRASFMYGNYDGLNSVQPNQSLQFDLHIGVNPWMTVNITDASKAYWFEAATVAPTSFIWLCLVNTGHGTPFISILEIRPLTKNLYPYVSDNQSIAFEFHLNYGPTNQTIRYPDDKYDRIWVPQSYDPKILTGLSTTDNITVYPDNYEAPLAVLQTALIPANNATNLTFLEWSPDNPSIGYVFVAFYSNVHIPPNNEWRTFNVFLNGKFSYGPYADPPYLQQYYANNPQPLPGNYFSWSFSADFNSTLPPIINAMEVFSVIPLRNFYTDFNDVAAINTIREQYQLKRNWEGDPCSPQQYLWSGVLCSYLINQLPRIIHLDLSSSGLKGPISESFSQLPALISLDLSCNNLTGAIPDSLATITSLQVLNLAGNSFTGSIPSSLKKKADAGIINLIISPSCNPKPSSGKSNKTLILILSTVVPASVVAITTIIIILVMRNRPNCQDMLIIISRKQSPRSSAAVDDDPELNVELRHFTYTQLKNITNDFSVEIGRGGFGTVYHGKLDNSTEVAVKVSSQPTAFHMNRQFLTEVRNLLQVHHKNLVSLIGYCKDREHLALIYEYMPFGSLHDHLRGKFETSRALNWGERLRIAHDAAQGLHYLHTGCNIIHRDVKTSNILLGSNLEAKIADFGLSKVSGNNSSPPTFSVVGTLGYIDPESHRTQSLNDKSDVYSFGVVLLELVTGELPVVTRRDRVHIVEHVKGELAKGNIDEICDKNMKGEYDTYSVWKVLDLAMRCTAETAAQRPKMAEVASQLDESLQVELSWRSKNVLTESSNSGISGGVLSLSSMGPSAR